MSRYSLKSLLLLLSLFLIPSSLAWTSYTHNWICDRAGLTELDCASPDTPKIQSVYKDASFRNHHCTNNSKDCSARAVADKYSVIDTIEAQAIAAHLYADSMVPVHWYSTDYDTCHKILEDKVEEKLRNSEDVTYKMLGKEYDFSSWNLSMKCTAKFGKENRTVDLYADNIYMDSVVAYVAEKMDATMVSKVQKEYDTTPILMVLLLLILAVFALFLYVGLKNKNKKQ